MTSVEVEYSPFNGPVTVRDLTSGFPNLELHRDDGTRVFVWDLALIQDTKQREAATRRCPNLLQQLERGGYEEYPRRNMAVYLLGDNKDTLWNE